MEIIAKTIFTTPFLKGKNMNKTDISILAGLVLAIALTFAADSNAHAALIRSQTLRLHVIADDDSPLAQETKLMVKNAISGICAELYCPAENYESAIKITEDNLKYIEETANHTLQQTNAGYTARCSLEKFYFDTTEYTGFTLPRGEYTALTVRLGRAQGKNWWCVVYPSLCLSAAAEYSDDESNTFISTDKFNIKFRTVEIWQEIQQYFTTAAPLYTNID